MEGKGRSEQEKRRVRNGSEVVQTPKFKTSEEGAQRETELTAQEPLLLLQKARL
jgi:hypothetical protein